LAAATILNFGKSGIWGNSIPHMVSVYQLAKFAVNIFINDRDMAQNPKSKMAAAAIFNFRKNVIFLYKLQWYSNVDLHTKFGTIGAEVAEIHLFIYFLDGGHRPSWNYLSFILDLLQRQLWWATFSLPVAESG